MSTKEFVDWAKELYAIRREVEDELARYCLDPKFTTGKIHHTVDEGYGLRCQRLHRIDADWRQADAAATEALKKDAGLLPLEDVMFAFLRATRK